ncbi:MAG TPA: NapC/NirT family cytochrome c [Coriobacteriia bacterium]
MRKFSLAGFKDPVRRPRYIVWTGVIVLLFAAFMIVALGATSTRWFCAEICHKVQDDAIIAYEKSSHSEISCMACHEPANANTIVFLLAKVKSLGEIPLAITGNYELPLNKFSMLALNHKEMGSGQCTQCHSSNRVVTPSPGIIINHKIHADKEVSCTTCHNRIAHNEVGWEPTLKDPKTGETPIRHTNYMKMTACFRCHDLEGKKSAPGACSACHPADFQLKPPSHLEESFFPKGHAELGKKDEEHVKEAAKEAEELKKELEAEGADPKLADPVPYCSTCHITSKFCSGCHGMEIPHPEEFKTKSHPEAVKTQAEKCVMCHGKPEETGFCDNCHHGSKISWTFDKAIPWKTQHAAAVVKGSVDSCIGACHEQTFCFDCHSKTKPLPSSHKGANWLHRANPDPFAKDKAVHATSAANIKACEICHGAGGTSAGFCMGCHKLPMAHPAEFKSFHAKTGRDNPAVCSNCHRFKEICGNCHHKGAKLDVPWRSIHAATVNAGGGADCFVKCHKKDFCVACHTSLKALPTTHKAATWLKRASIETSAAHPAAFKAGAENCTYCHGDGGVSAPFCNNCHKLPMPHPDGFGTKDDGGTHAADAKAGKLTKAVCANCHTVSFCNNCHHGYAGPAPWLKQHPTVVKAGDPQQCFAKCHKETFCSYCHVRLIH